MGKKARADRKEERRQIKLEERRIRRDVEGEGRPPRSGTDRSVHVEGLTSSATFYDEYFNG